MMYSELYEKMLSCSLIGQNYKNLLRLIEMELNKEADKDDYLKLILLYFSFINDGNVYMSLDKDKVLGKLKEKIDGQRILCDENGQDWEDELKEIHSEFEAACGHIAELSKLPIVGANKLFIATDDRFYTRKYYNASNEIVESVKRLFGQNPVRKASLDYKSVVDTTKFSLTSGQEEVLEKGYYNNILVTGGPGTGKTTSVFFLLLTLLYENPDSEVYLTAFAGKAASRMKDSILQGAEKITSNDTKVLSVIDKIKSLEEYTIHRLLGVDWTNGGFKHSNKNQFSEKSIFVIDEASMIDICIFASLLSAIPKGARVFILGDKNQLPSVECGAVYSDLLQELPKENKVELVESKRFTKESKIFELSEAINRGDPEEKLPVSEEDWKPYVEFNVEPAPATGEYPIYYYSDKDVKDSDMITYIASKWGEHYYKDFQKLCSGIEISAEDTSALNTINERAEEARILCANNETVRGTQNINRIILEQNYDHKRKVGNYYVGELLMVTKNNDPINLYNGDCGVAVTFKGDETLYVMFKKGTKLRLDEGKAENKIFKLGEYIFYPVRLISSDEIVPAFAITIHKSQGSDFQNIMVIMPKKKGHPLLYRQIVYTAITRTKGNTYILSNQENLEYARDTRVSRDTGIEI